MKTKLGWIGLALALVIIAKTGTAQVTEPYCATPYDSGGFQPMVGDLRLGMPGRIWIGSSVADRGLGYQGSYLTLGSKTPIGEDFFDGRWCIEARGHFSTESQNFFGNVGLERIISIDAAGADVSLGVWGDWDDDRQGSFAHSFSQVAVSGAIKTRRWDLIGNGYFPVGTTDYALGDPTGQNVFHQNRIVVVPGIDSALTGFDATLRMRPVSLGRINGRIDLGGYGYRSDLVDFFGGGRVRLGMQVLRGLIVSAEVNHDDRFDTTGVLQMSWMFGANARGNEYSALGRDLEPTVRNDHIVRFQQDVVWAIDPDTGLAYHVWHVDNSADSGVSDGTFERRFTTLAEAEAASADDDIIFVHFGFGNSQGMSDGIVLKDGQLLLGSGVQHLIPIQGGRLFELSNPQDGNRPIITNVNFASAVTLANRNTVRGFEIDGNAGGMVHGIFADGFLAGSPITDGIIEDNVIHDAILNGVSISTLAGDWEVNRNTVFNNQFDGMLFADAVDSTSEFNFEENDVSANGRNGIHLVGYDAERITFRDNATDGNLRDGVRLDSFTNGAGTGLFLDFFGHQAIANVEAGVNVIDGDGNLRFVNGFIAGNGGSGLRLRDWRNTDPTHRTVIATTAGGTSNFFGNGIGTGAGVDNVLTFGTQRLLVTQSTFDGNGTGIRSISDGLTAALTTQIVDNLEISNSLSFGIDTGAFNGSLHNLAIQQTGAAFPGTLPLINNGTVAGDAIRMLVGDASGTIATMVADIRNVDIAGTGGSGIFASVIDDGNLNLVIEGVNVTGSAGTGILFDFDTNLNLAINSVTMNNVNVIDNAGSSVVLLTGGGTYTDLIMTNVVMSHTGTGGLQGLAIVADGDGLAGVDNRTRVLLSNSLISNHNLNGILVNTTNDANLFLEISSNSIVGNGAVGDPNALPFLHGINILADDESVLSTRITNNLVTGNFERGIVMESGGTATLNALLVGNNFGLNDVGEDPGNDPIIDSNIEDAIFINGPTSTFCLAMSNNVFAFDVSFLNLGAAIQFFIELDGLTNGFGPGALGPGFTFGPFGAVCPVLIDLEEAAFLADGFPPR